MARSRNSGFVLVTTVASTVVLTAFAGLAIDTGYLQLVKTRMQTAADAAALGGAQEVRMNGATHAVTAAKGDSALNGFTDGVDSVSITVNNPPATGFYTADSTAVEVIVSQSVKTLFLSVFGFSSSTVRARSVARLGASPTCVYVLDPAAGGAFQISGGVNVQINCGLYVNSSSATALQASGGAHLTSSAIQVVGNYSSSGGASLSPTPTAHAAAQSDPLAYLTAPSVGSCNFTDYSVSGGATKVLSQGVYCKGISLSGGSRVTFNPGLYILLGGGLSISGGATVTGDGVTFYNTSATGKPYGAISFSGGASVNLSAATSGALPGILFFQDRAAGAGAGSNFSGGTNIVLSGALYFPTTSVSYSGGTDGKYTIIVSKTLTFSGGSTFNSDYSSLPAGSPIKGGAALCE